MSQRIHFVTGRLAEFSLRKELAELAPRVGFAYTVDVLGITVAALLTTDWVARHVQVPAGTERVILPGYCQGELDVVARVAGVPVERGPKDLRRLGEYFGKATTHDDYGAYSIEILAEINHAPRFTLHEILAQAAELQEQGADLIDLGCDPGSVWPGASEAVSALVAQGYRVSIDSMDPREIAPAALAGAELVLSVNSANRAAAVDWGVPVVVVPDDPATLAGLDETIEFLAGRGVPLAIDPILEPIGFGFAASLGRYVETRRRYPDAEMLMGIGNLTELTDADSAPINVLLLGICEELGIRRVLTTQVINWARTSVRECDLARRLVHYACANRVLPKRLEPKLVMLRDAEVPRYEAAMFDQLAEQLKDPNYRLFAEGGQIHAVTAGLHASDADPFALFEQLARAAGRPIDANHAFYLGFEMAKALTALKLNKDYRQDEALDWGFLTQAERHHRLPRNPARPNDLPAGSEDPE